MKERQQNSSGYPLPFLLVLSSDHQTGATGLSPTVTLSKNGAAFASPAGAVTEIANGWYVVAGNATDSNTLGPLILHATGAAADVMDSFFTVVGYNPFDSVRLGLTALPNAAAAASGGLPTFGAGSGQINPASGKVPATLAATDVTGNVACDLQTIKTQTVTAAAGVTFPTSIGTSTFAGGAVASVAGAVASVTAPVTVGTNNDKGGYSLTQAFPTNFASLAIDLSTGGVTVKTNSDKIGYTASTVSDKTGYSLAGSQTFSTTGGVGSVSGAVASVTAPVTVGTNNDKSGYSGVVTGTVSLAAAGLDAVVTETGYNARQALALILDTLLGKLSGVPLTGAGTIVIRDVNDTANRVTVGVDGNGNRTSLALNPPA